MKLYLCLLQRIAQPVNTCAVNAIQHNRRFRNSPANVFIVRVQRIIRYRGRFLTVHLPIFAARFSIPARRRQWLKIRIPLDRRLSREFFVRICSSAVKIPFHPTLFDCVARMLIVTQHDERSLSVLHARILIVVTCLYYLCPNETNLSQYFAH